MILEGGGTLNWSALQAGIVQKVQAYVASKLFGGTEAKTPVEGQGFHTPADAVELTRTKITALGSDWLIEGISGGRTGGQYGMFTGIIEEMGTILRASQKAHIPQYLTIDGGKGA